MSAVLVVVLGWLVRVGVIGDGGLAEELGKCLIELVVVVVVVVVVVEGGRD